ncbi:MAG: major facilitator family protein MmrA, partial [Pseudomonadota bacterium]
LGALSSRVPLAHERARFMSLQSAVQHGAAALGAVLSAQLLSERADHSLAGMPKVASVAIALALFLPFLLRGIERELEQRDAAATARDSTRPAPRSDRGAPAVVHSEM